MKFIISDTFTDSLARLTDQEQKAVKTTAFDLQMIQMNAANPAMQFHKLDRGHWFSLVYYDSFAHCLNH